jgi:SNF2 family DNA or RNA helicase
MWHDPKHNVLIYERPDPKLLQFAVGAKQINGSYVAMPATLTNMQIARHLGLPVIRPLVDYDYPHGGHIKDPFHAQRETANFLAVNPRAFVLSDMGTGKTLSALWAADALMRDAEARGQRLAALVVAPLSTLQTVWADAVFANFLGRRKAVIVHGSTEKRLAALNEDADFYIINHDGPKNGARFLDAAKRRKLELRGFAAALAARTDIRLVIIDEAGAYRDHRSMRSRVLHAFISGRDFAWAMTGTPTPNGPLDAFGIAKLINNAKGEVFTHFRNRIMMQPPGSKFKWIPRRGAMAEAHALMQPAIRFSIEDCQDLPELVVQDRDVPLSAEQEKWMRELKNEFLLELRKGTITAVNEAALRLKLLQIASGVVYDEHHKEHKVDVRPRFAALRDIIDQEAAKVLVFAQFISTVNMLNAGLTEFSRAVIVGATSVKERTALIRSFQQERDPRVLIAHPETIAEGQTLTAAATVVWWSPTDKTRLYLQGNKRIHRPGQDRNCTVVNLSGSKVEREVYRRLANNETMQGLLLKMAEG